MRPYNLLPIFLRKNVHNWAYKYFFEGQNAIIESFSWKYYKDLISLQQQYHKTMKKIFIRPEVLVVSLEPVEICTTSPDSTKMFNLSSAGSDDDDSNKAKGRNSIWDD